ncbi:MAG: BMP family ABC transporter substrate-binding protein, partial [Clostridia bacterium]
TAVLNAIDTLAGKGCKIIFGISFGYIEAFAEASAKTEYKDIIFSHATGYKSNEKNFNNYFGRIYQARYLSGIAAGLKSLELKNNSLGYVAAYGTEYAETCSGINAFTLGAQSVNPAAVVHVKKINTWGDESLEKQAAEALIATYNCCVISQHCDSAQPQIVAENKAVFGCGYNSDMTVQAPKAHLVAPVWNWDVYYGTAIRAAIEKPAEFVKTIGNYYGGLKEGFVAISPVSSNCSEGTDKIISAVKDLIISGEWDVFSGAKLSYEKGADGKYTIKKTNAALVKADDSTIVEAGGKSVDDGVIKGSMNYYVKGVTEG